MFQVLFSDESHFEVQGQRSQFVRRSIGEKIRSQHVEQHVKHPDKQMYWGCFSHGGVGPLAKVDGIMRSEQYIKIIRHQALPELKKRFPHNDGIFQQDLAPCHTSKKVKQFFQSKKLNVLPWPGNSPDLNPIENLWAIVKRHLRSKDCTTRDKLISAIGDIWTENNLELSTICANLVESMPRRVQKCLKARGGHTGY